MKNSETNVWNEIDDSGAKKLVFNGGITSCKAVEYKMKRHTSTAIEYTAGRLNYEWEKKCL